MKKFLSLALVLLLALGVLAGCGGGNDASGSQSFGDASNMPAPTGDGEYKDTVILATGSDQNYMDGQMNNTNDKVLRTVYSSLVKRDQNNEIVGDLAESWEISDDNLTWTFYLRQDVKFHNGKQFTSADVKASYDRLLAEDSLVRYASTMRFITDVSVVDDYTITMTTENPSPVMLANLCHRANLILDADYIEEYGLDLGLTAESCNGTGPYRLVQWDKDEMMVFEAFDDYFEGKPPTQNFIIQIIPDTSSRAMALETGEVDIADGLAVEDVLRLQDVEGISVNFYKYQGLHGFQFNCAHEYLSDSRLRRAVSHAINRQAIIDALYAPIGEYCATAPVSEVVFGYTDLGVVPYDPELSKQLMEEAGYADGFEFSILVYPNYNQSLPSAEMIVQDLAAVGITATIEIVDNAGFNAMQGNRTYPGENFPWGMFIMGYGPSSLDADEGLRRLWTTSPDGNNNNNYGWYSNEEVDTLLPQAQVEMDPAKRIEIYKRVMEIVYLEDPAAVFTNQRRIIYCMSDKVEGFQVDMRNAINYTTLACRA
ncbi:ABC transporter substrate-binding protein [Ruminococcaceae bacterium OttesenSCG-928-O06]|nr:ABC transporter substrate-binding protein [Ruminococcaceae bacterium OttesenSCG-928-O06]